MMPTDLKSVSVLRVRACSRRLTITFPVRVKRFAQSIGVISIAPIARIVRANTLSFSQREFVLAARVLGAEEANLRHALALARAICLHCQPALDAGPASLATTGAVSAAQTAARVLEAR